MSKSSELQDSNEFVNQDCKSPVLRMWEPSGAHTIESAVTKTHTYSTGHSSLQTAIYHFLREQFLGKPPLKTFFFQNNQPFQQAMNTTIIWSIFHIK